MSITTSTSIFITPSCTISSTTPIIIPDPPIIITDPPTSVSGNDNFTAYIEGVLGGLALIVIVGAIVSSLVSCFVYIRKPGMTEFVLNNKLISLYTTGIKRLSIQEGNEVNVCYSITYTSPDNLTIPKKQTGSHHDRTSMEGIEKEVAPLSP